VSKDEDGFRDESKRKIVINNTDAKNGVRKQDILSSLEENIARLEREHEKVTII
jgi:hypothetical protein